MREIRLRDLTRGLPAPDRVALLSIWFEGHNNPRYAELLPRLERLDACLIRMSERRIPRGVQYRAFHASRTALYAGALGRASRRYSGLLSLDVRQHPHFDGPIVADVDDPFFTEREVELLRHPNLAAYVVTAEHAGRRYEELGVEAPWVVVPQGVSLSTATPQLRAEAAARRRPDRVVVGWMAAHLLIDGDRGAEGPLYNVDHLLELWEEIHARAPQAELWLVGGPSDRLRRRLEGRDDVVLYGRLPRDRALATAAAFDVSVYPRTQDTGIRAAKVAELIGLGVPIVSYDYEVTANVREAGAGLLVGTPREFVDAVVALVEDASVRAALSDSARAAGAALDWDVLARRYEDEVLNRFLPPGSPGRDPARGG
jgi:glycosyltransferase involved in cell wall biosynthesis